MAAGDDREPQSSIWISSGMTSQRRRPSHAIGLTRSLGPAVMVCPSVVIVFCLAARAAHAARWSRWSFPARSTTPAAVRMAAGGRTWLLPAPCWRGWHGSDDRRAAGRPRETGRAAVRTLRPRSAGPGSNGPAQHERAAGPSRPGHPQPDPAPTQVSCVQWGTGFSGTCIQVCTGARLPSRAFPRLVRGPKARDGRL